VDEVNVRRYRCPNGHVVGFIRSEGHSVNRLLLLRDSIDEQADAVGEPVAVAAIIDSGDLTCTICGASMVWIPSVPTLAKLIARVQVLRQHFRAVEREMNNGSFLERG
jgi:hypothetical protein